MASATFNASFRVEGLRSVSRAVRESDDATNEWLRDGLQKIGERVAVDVRNSYSVYSAVGAGGVKSKVTKPGNVVVAQTLRRGRDMNRRRANFGGLMMRKAFLPALDKHEADVAVSVGKLFSDLERIWA
jgi:hypothetical protein